MIATAPEPSRTATGPHLPPGPMRRRGPRPLLLHLAHAMGRQGPTAPAPLWAMAGFPPLGPGAAVDPALLAGIAAYRRHPFARAMPTPPTIWREGESCLLDYGEPGHAGATLLFVPSLINRGYVLDLAPGRSMLRWLAARGRRPLLLEWGAPDPAARAFTLTDYVAGRLERALEACGPEPVVLVGYCLGGLLALALAQRRPRAVAALVLLATPWDFHAEEGRAAAKTLAGTLPMLEPMLATAGMLPTDMLQMLLSLPDLDGVARRYTDFAEVDPESERARVFVALEDWLSDGMPLAAPVVRECLGGWYGRNTPMRGEWRIAGAVVEPARIAAPTFAAVPGRDRIVPPASARPLASLIANATAHAPAAGHIGMVAGGGAETGLWAPMLDWLRQTGV